MRLFIAVPLPRELADRAAACLPTALPALRPVSAELMHVTLAFLGRAPDDRLAPAVDAARAAVEGHTPFSAALDHAGRFPASGPPRAVWLGVGAGRDALNRLAADVARELAVRGFALEERPFAAHLTIARVRATATGPELRRIGSAVAALAVPEIQVRVDRIAVVESVLTPKGPRYTSRAEIGLG